MSYQVHNFQTGDIIEAAPVNEMDQQIQTNERDIAAKADKVAQATNGNFAGLDANGNLTDSGSKASDFLTQHQDISGKLDKNQGSENSGKFMKVGNDGELSPANVPDPTGKADKVANATSGNFAGLDANGNLTDSGSKASDFLTSHQDISGKADKVSGATNGNFASLDSNGNLLDSGHRHSDYLTEHQDISGKLDASEKGTANGVAELGSDGKVPSSQLPSYVDDVLEYANISSFPTTGESGKIYIALDTNKTYRWSGTTYVPISSDLALGETSSTAYRGDRGKIAYDHATDNGRLTTAQTSGLYKIATTKEGHVASVTPVAKSDITALGIPGQDTTYSDMTGAGAGSAGDHGLVPAPAAGDNMKFLRGDGTWAETGGGSGSYATDIPMSSSDSTSVYNAIGEKTDKVPSATNGNFASFDSNGNVQDSGSKASDFLTQHQDISGKADKVSSATNGNFASLDSNGNLTDSGHKHSDYITSHQDISGKADKVSNATSGNFASLDANGNLTDSGHKHSDYLTQHQDISGKLDKDQGSGNSGKFMKVGSDGLLVPDNVPNPQVMTGATASTAGTDGLVPAPSAGDQDKVLKGNGAWGTVDALPSVTSSDNGKVLEVVSGAWAKGSEKIGKNYAFTDGFEAVTFSGLTNFNGDKIWTDGENIYYDTGSISSGSHYVLEKTTLTWSAKTWSGLGYTSFEGGNVWTDGDNIYYSISTSQFVLDKSTSTWSAKTWTGLTDFNGSYIWKDGDNIYYSFSGNNYELNKSTSTWSAKTWTGLSFNLNGSYIWTDGSNIYTSDAYGHYVLNRSTSSWSSKSWSGFTSWFYGNRVWTDGTNIYYSYNSDQYVLNVSTSTWIAKSWAGYSTINGYYVWSDGGNVYYSKGENQYKKAKDESVIFGNNGEYEKMSLSNFTEKIGVDELQDQVTSLTDAIAELKTPEIISAKSLFAEVDASGLAEINDSNSSLFKLGRFVFGQMRFTLKTNLGSSTTLFTPKTQALKAKWYPSSTPTNYAVFPAFSTWDASKTALVFMNDSWEFGIGVATAGDYVATLSYVARS